MSRKLGIFLGKIKLGEKNPGCFSLFLSRLLYCVLGCHWASFPRCPGKVWRFSYLRLVRMGRSSSHPFCEEVGIGAGVSLCSSSCKAGGSASFSSSSEAAPTPLGSGVPFHFAPFRLCSFFSQWQLLYVRRHKEPKMSFRCLQTSCCSGFEIPFHMFEGLSHYDLWLCYV